MRKMLTQTIRVGILSLFILHLSLSFAQTVEFSMNGWLYHDAFTLKLMQHGVSADSGYTIHYTTNGSLPTAESPLYGEPLRLSSLLYSTSNLFRIQNAPDDNWHCPPDVERIVVIRAALFSRDGRQVSPVNTQSYVVASLLGRTIQLPVVSICTDSAGLYNPDTGLAMRGRHFNPALPNSTGNYFQRGREWERRASFAFYDPASGIPFTQDCGLRMHGSSQRARSQKGFSLYARRQYGDSRLRHDFFSRNTSHTSNTSYTTPPAYKRLVLRPWRTSWSGAGIEDWLCQRLAEPLACDHLETRPVVLFLNGEYWGIYFLEEKADEYYVEEHYDIDHNWVNLLSGSGDFVEHGSGQPWDDLTRWLVDADLANPDDYELFASQVDIDALTDYMLLQILVCNADWPANNVRLWNAPDQPFRWIFYDGDGTLAKYHANNFILNNLTCNDSTQVYPSSPQATLLFRRLLANPDFVQRSSERLREMSTGELDPRRSAVLLDDIVSQVEDEVPYQVARFNFPRSVNQWRSSVTTIADFLRVKPTTMTADYIAHFGDDNIVTSVDVSDANVTVEAARAAETTFSVYDVYGRVIHSGRVSLRPGSNALRLPAVPAGRYFLVVGDKNITLLRQ